MKFSDVQSGMEVKIKLTRPYTEKEIRSYGCHPGVDGMRAKVTSLDSDPKIVELQLKTALDPLPEMGEKHQYKTDKYYELAKNLEPVNGLVIRADLAAFLLKAGWTKHDEGVQEYTSLVSYSYEVWKFYTEVRYYEMRVVTDGDVDIWRDGDKGYPSYQCRLRWLRTMLKRWDLIKTEEEVKHGR